MAAMRGQVSASCVNVEVDAKPQADMSRTMQEIRSQYEGIADKNRREMEAWHQGKVRGTRLYIMFISSHLIPAFNRRRVLNIKIAF